MRKLSERASIRFYLPRILCFLLTLLCLVFIFGNSLDNAQESARKSGFVVKLIQKVFDAVFPGTVVREVVIRKIGHFSEFALLGLLLLLCVRVHTERYLQNIFIPLFFSLAAAVSDEMIQLAGEGRSSEVRDVVIDFSGAVTGIIICILCVILYNRAATKKRAVRETECEL